MVDRNDTPRLGNEELAKLRTEYERIQSLTDPKARSKSREAWDKQFAAARKCAETLKASIDSLPAERLFDLDEEGQPDYNLLSRLSDDLSALLYRFDVYERPAGKNLCAVADEFLIKALWRRCPDPKCYYSDYARAYTGSFVNFLEDNLPLLGIDVGVQKLARQAARLKLPR